MSLLQFLASAQQDPVHASDLFGPPRSPFDRTIGSLIGTRTPILLISRRERMATRGRREDLEKRMEQLTADRDYYRNKVHKDD